MRRLTAVVLLVACAVLQSPGARSADAYRLLRLDGGYVKWGPPSLGAGAVVRYAFVAEPMSFAGARNCPEMAPVGALLKASKIDPALFRREVAAAAAMWQAAADISFEASPATEDADILIGAQGRPTGWAFTNVSDERSSRSSVHRISKALICLNPTRRWKVGFGQDPAAYDLRYVIAHELGHAIGLDHPGPNGELMVFSYAELFRTLQPGDVAGAVALYGTSATTATVALPGKTGAPKPVSDVVLR